MIRIDFRVWAASGLLLAACSTEAAPAAQEPSEAAEPTQEAEQEAEPAAEAEAEEQTQFGDELSDRETTTLASITDDPQQFAGQVVKTEGEITQVCQRMGCWMEMRAEGAPAVRVPMAGHSFFLPRDASGRHATIEGEVALRELSDAEREHLASEGAQVVASALQINATGVVLR